VENLIYLSTFAAVIGIGKVDHKVNRRKEGMGYGKQALFPLLSN